MYSSCGSFKTCDLNICLHLILSLHNINNCSHSSSSNCFYYSFISIIHQSQEEAYTDWFWTGRLIRLCRHDCSSDCYGCCYVAMWEKYLKNGTLLFSWMDPNHIEQKMCSYSCCIYNDYYKLIEVVISWYKLFVDVNFIW